jgi:hypothetical protein
MSDRVTTKERVAQCHIGDDLISNSKDGIGDMRAERSKRSRCPARMRDDL